MHELLHFKQDLLDLPIHSLMSTEIISVTPKSLLSKAIGIMEERKIHHIPVVDDDGVCVGVLSSSDVLQVQDSLTRLEHFDRTEKNKEIAEWLLVENVMTRQPVTVHADEKVGQVVEILLENRHRSVLVEDGDACVGIVTPMDFIKYLFEEQWLR